MRTAVAALLVSQALSAQNGVGEQNDLIRDDGTTLSIQNRSLSIGTTLPTGAPAGTLGTSVIYSPNGALNVKAFGAKCDGKTDDLTSFNAAVAAGPHIYVPPGVCALSGALTFHQALGPSIIGAGGLQSTLLFTGATDGIVFASKWAVWNATIRDLGVRTSDASGGKAISFAHTTWSTSNVLDNVVIDRMGPGRWAYGLWLSNVEVSAFSSVTVRGATVGVHLQNNSNANTFTAPDIAGGVTGFETVGSEDSTIHGGAIQSSSKALVSIGAGSGLSIIGMHLEGASPTVNGIVVAGGIARVSDCIATNHFANFVQTDGGGSIHLQNNTVTVNAAGALVYASGASSSGGSPSRVVGNSLSNSNNAGGVGVVIAGGFSFEVSGNTIKTKGMGTTLQLGTAERVATHPLIIGNALAPGAGGYCITPMNASGVIAEGNEFFGVEMDHVFSTSVRAYGSGNFLHNGTPYPISAVAIAAFSALPICDLHHEGAQQGVTDSTTTTWGAVIAGGGVSHVLAYCDGTNWTVMAK